MASGGAQKKGCVVTSNKGFRSCVRLFYFPEEMQNRNDELLLLFFFILLLLLVVVPDYLLPVLPH